MWWRREKKEIAEFLYKLLVADSRKGYARDVARRMEVPYPTLSKYWLGKRRFPAALVKPLFLATDQDVRVAEFFLLSGSDYGLDRKTDTAPPEDIAREVMLLGKLVGRVADRYLGATAADGEEGDSISEGEVDTLRAEIQKLIAHADKLRVAFEL